MMMEEGEVGEIIITSLMRMRNPLVRYLTGMWARSIHIRGSIRDSTSPYVCTDDIRISRLL